LHMGLPLNYLHRKDKYLVWQKGTQAS
jgi:hypothetical protein